MLKVYCDMCGEPIKDGEKFYTLVMYERTSLSAQDKVAVGGLGKKQFCSKHAKDILNFCSKVAESIPVISDEKSEDLKPVEVISDKKSVEIKPMNGYKEDRLEDVIHSNDESVDPIVRILDGFKPTKIGRSYSEETKNKVFELHQAGISNMRISKETGICMATVYNIIEERSKSTNDVVTTLISKYNVDVNKILALLKVGTWSVSEIASDLNKSEDLVNKICSELRKAGLV